MTCDPNNSSVVYTAGYTGVIYVSKSTDGGASWARYQVCSTYDSPYSLIVDRTNSNVLYVGGMNSLYKSTNGGVSWFASGTGLTGYVYDIAVGATKANVIYAGSSAGVFKSTNAGASWTNTGCSNVYAVEINPGNESEVYAATTNAGVYKSTNSGTSWAPMNTGLPNLYTTCLGIYPANYLFVSTYGNGMYRWNIMVSAEEMNTDQPGMRISVMPNPSHDRTDIRYTIHDTGSKDHYLKVFDASGRLVRDLSIDLASRIRNHASSVSWDGRDDQGQQVASGIYFCRLESGDVLTTEPVIIVR